MSVHNTALLAILRHYGAKFQSCPIFFALFWVKKASVVAGKELSEPSFCLNGPLKRLTPMQTLDSSVTATALTEALPKCHLIQLAAKQMNAAPEGFPENSSHFLSGRF